MGDQKALLTELGMEVHADFFGQRAETDSGDSPEFRDVHPNQFFLVLLNFVGKGLPIIIDRYTGHQVWNHPVAGYRVEPIRPSDHLGVHPTAVNVFRVMSTVQIWWLRDDVTPGHLTEPFEFRDGDSYESRTLRYELWLDAPPIFDSAGELVASGNVVLVASNGSTIGGTWRNGNLETANSYPDYIWIPRGVAPSSGFTNPYVDLGWALANFARRQ